MLSAFRILISHIFDASYTDVSVRNDNICYRGLLLSDTLRLCGTSRPTSNIQVSFDRWEMVAITYDFLSNTGSLYLGGNTLSMNITSMGSVGNILIGGSPTGARGFHGYIDNIFVYNTLLSTDALDLLRLGVTVPYMPSSKSSGFAMHFQHDFGLVIPSTPSLSSFTQLGIMFWVKMDTMSTAESIIIDKSCKGKEFRVSLIDDISRQHRRIKIYIGQGNVQSKGVWAFASSVDVIQGVGNSYWQHIAVSWDGKLVSVYINGTFIDSMALINRNTVITDFGSDIYIGKPCSRLEDDELIGIFSGSLDSLSIWNGPIDKKIQHGKYLYSPVVSSSSSATADPLLVAYFPFDEGYGLDTKAVTGGDNSLNVISAQFNPWYNTDIGLGANQLWKVSDAPLNDIVRTVEDVPVVIRLNGTDPLSRSVFYQLQSLPLHGQLFEMTQKSPTFNANGTLSDVIYFSADDGSLLFPAFPEVYPHEVF